MSRGASVRNGPKPQLAKLNIDTSGNGGGGKYEKTSAASERRTPSSNIRSANSTPARGYSRRDQQRRGVRSDEDGEDAYPDELYDMYQPTSRRGSRNPRRPAQQQQQRYIEEEEEGSDYDDGSFDEGEFEMVSNNPPRRTGTNSTSSGRGMSRRPDVRKIRVKVHAEDVRYIMIGAAVEFPDFVERIQEKFGLRRRFKIKVRDDDLPNGDMITMGDQDDLDMVIMTCKSIARKTRQDIGKMEVSITSLRFAEEQC